MTLSEIFVRGVGTGILGYVLLGDHASLLKVMVFAASLSAATWRQRGN